jgi:hypothetical protein
MPFARPSGRWQRRAGIAPVLIALTALAVATERAGWLAGGGGDHGGAGRAWIWADVDPRDVRPRAFFAVAELELDGVPERAALEVQGDEEYVLWINGRRAGSGAYQAGSPLDLYDVAPLLRTGTNRIALELRSATGSGAATLRLSDADGRVLLESGPGWRHYPSAVRGLLDAAPLRATSEARVLGHSPFGRWGDPPTGERRPLFDDTVAEPRPRRARRFRLPLDGAGAAGAPASGWLRQPRSDERRPGRGPLVEFDFGREVTGYLTLAVRGRETAAGLLRFGDRPLARGGFLPDAIAITIAERGSWQAARPRRFRYVAVAGLDGVVSAAVLVVDPERTSIAPSTPAAPGLLGITPPPRRLPVVDATWKRIRDLGATAVSPSPPAAASDLRTGGAGRTREPAREPGARRRPGTARGPDAPAPRALRRAPAPRRASPPVAPAPGSPPAPRG